MQGMRLFQVVFMLLDAPLKLFVCEPVQGDVHRCLRAWQPHQRGSGMRCCCCFVRLLLSFHGDGLQSYTVASVRHLLCPLVPAASRAARGRTSSPRSRDLSHVRTIFYKKIKIKNKQRGHSAGGAGWTPSWKTLLETRLILIISFYYR